MFLIDESKGCVVVFDQKLDQNQNKLLQFSHVVDMKETLIEKTLVLFVRLKRLVNQCKLHLMR